MLRTPLMSGVDAALARHLIGCALLDTTAKLLGRIGIPVMPLKGIWLQRLVYADPRQRMISDVDVLVPEHHYEQAQASLMAAGWKLRSSNVAESSYTAPDWRLPLDLHRRLFTRQSFRLSTADMFARGREDTKLFGAPVVLPDPLDGFAHVLGHFVKSRGYASAADNALRDLPLMAAKLQLDPQLCAQRLAQCGMARAARYALPLIASSDQAAFGPAVLHHLPNDPPGSAIAFAMRTLRAHCSEHSPWAALPGFALEPTLPKALQVFALRAWDKPKDHKAE
jgi:Uncharacterised nucleotidyltransferase